MKIEVAYKKGNPSRLDLHGPFGKIQLINDNGRIHGIDTKGKQRSYSVKKFKMMNALQQLAGSQFPEPAQVHRFILGTIAQSNDIQYFYEFKEEFLILGMRVPPLGDLHKIGGAFAQSNGKTSLTNIQLLIRPYDEGLQALGKERIDGGFDKLIDDMKLLSEVGFLTKEKVKGYLEKRGYHGVSNDLQKVRT